MVSQQLGHRDLTTTLRYYGKFIPKKAETRADILERGILEPTPQAAIPEPTSTLPAKACSRVNSDGANARFPPARLA